MEKRSVIIFCFALVFGALFLGCAGQNPETTPSTTPAQTPKAEEKVDCPVGSYFRTQEGEFRITGIERQTVSGKSMDMCCMEVITGAKKAKFCHDMVAVELGMWGYRNAVYWITDEETGIFYKAMEGFEKDGKYCARYFDVSGEQEQMMCNYEKGSQTCFVIYDKEGKVQAEGCS
ncbi:MAG: hypothetical protein NZ879_01905 [Archaeoglobaceae archaeon]|nr:hypothetical protein [Archaeoglobaceae archaeon]MDW8117718.1 hypothetical protein [Archaeoglobaceae archaeon]